MSTPPSKMPPSAYEIFKSPLVEQHRRRVEREEARLHRFRLAWRQRKWSEREIEMLREAARTCQSGEELARVMAPKLGRTVGSLRGAISLYKIRAGGGNGNGQQ